MRRAIADIATRADTGGDLIRLIREKKAAISALQAELDAAMHAIKGETP